MRKKSIWDKIVSFEYHKYLPSRRVGILIGGICAAIILIVLFINSRGISYNPAQLSVVTVGDAIEQDSDGDGIPDWEERLWGTNPRSADSDSDGVPDGTEISQKKDELAAANGYASSTFSLTDTDRFARELFVTYNALSNQGQVSKDASTSFANAAISTTVSKIPPIQLVTAADIATVPSSQAANLAYKNKIADLLQANNSRLGNEFELIHRGIGEGNADILRDANAYTPIYSKFKLGLMKLTVPANQVENHVRLVNNVSYIINTLPQLEAIEDDTIRGIPLYTIYTQSFQDMIKTFEAIGVQQ
jgi:hypothetical protein